MQESNLEDLKRKKKNAQVLVVSIGVAGFAMFCVLALLEYKMAWMVVVGSLVAMLRAKQKERELSTEILIAELDDLGARETQSDENERLSALAEQESIAGIAFDTPAGQFEGRVVYQYASKDGQTYEYDGLASAKDSPTAAMLIVNGLIYRMMGPKTATATATPEVGA